MVQKADRWRSLIPGLIVIAVMAALAVFTLTYARLGALRGPTYTLILPVTDAGNVILGTDVWLAGKRVGEVAGIRFGPVDLAPEERLLLELRVLSRYRDLIRHDSRAEIQSSGTLLGAPIINIGVGTPAAAALAEGDTLHPAPGQEMADFLSRVAELGPEFDQIAGNVRLIRERSHGLEEAAGRLDSDRRRIMTLLRGEPLRQPLPRRPGSARLLFEDGELGVRLDRIRASVDTVMVVLEAPTGTLGNLRTQDEIGRRLESISAELDEASRLLRGGYGTAGRMMHDRALVEGLESLRLQVDLLGRDFARWPERYLRF